MERRPSDSVSVGGVFASCGECLKLNLPWRKKKSRSCTKHRSTGAICDVTTTFYPPVKKKQKRPTRVGGFKYDPLSYAQNFDDGAIDDVDEEEFFSHGFTSRFAALHPSKSCNADAGNICAN